jgi:hypothetical protein
MTLTSKTEFSLTVPNSPHEWFEWLKAQEESWKAVYRERPSLFIAHYNHEQESTRDYVGREILELLQNANDAATETGIPGKVKIILTQEGLIVGNTGAPFTIGGVESLQTSNLSPKRHQRRLFVGSKGLGFRAVLNWSKYPMILSGELRLAYSSEDIVRRTQSLLNESRELALKVLEESPNSSALIAPILVFPSFTENGDLTSLITDPSSKKILEKCQELLSEGYTTTIGMPFDQPKAIENAQSQINSLAPELLLFVPYLSEIVISQEDLNPQCWRRETDPTHVRVLSDDKILNEWRVYQEVGEIPTEFQSKVAGGRVDYEICLAIPKMIQDSNRPLFSFFPTEIPFPLPFVCHATLELSQNRKQLQGSKNNEFVITRLAEFIVQKAVEYGDSVPDDPWACCDLLINRGDFGLDLEKLGFYNTLINACKKNRIIPTLQGKRIIPSEARLLQGASEDWLPSSLFGEIIPERNADPDIFNRDKKFFQRLSITTLDDSTFSQKLANIEKLDIDERAALVAGMINHSVSKKLHSSSLLIDSTGIPVPENTRVFLLPSINDQTIILPEWADLRFLNENFKRILQERLNAKDVRELYNNISSFRVVEYSLVNLISSLVAAANRRIRESPEHTDQIHHELLQALFDLFQKTVETNQKFPSESNVMLLNQKGFFSDARKIYFGQCYPPFGNITQELYGTWAPELLLASPESLGLNADISSLIAFLEWIGVARFPREQIQPLLNEHHYTGFIVHGLTYPAIFKDFICHNPNEVRLPSTSDVKTIDGLQSILDKADPFAILSWLATDNRAIDWQRLDPSHAKLSMYPQKKQARFFSGPLPSYIFWKISHTKWLLTTDGEKEIPVNCMAAERAIEALFRRPLIPSEENLQKYYWLSSSIRDAWQRAGVIPGLAYLEKEELYRLLLELPTRSPDGQSAGALYEWMIESDSLAIGIFGPNFERFQKEGKMWGREGEKTGYFPVSQLHHADSEDLPKVLLQKLKLVDLPKRVGTEKVERIFGVKPIDRQKIHQEIKNHQLAFGSSEAAKEFEEIKEYLLVLRKSRTAQIQQVKKLQSLKLTVCSEITASIEYESQPFEFELAIHDWLLIDEILYVRSDPTEQASIRSNLLADALGAAIGSMFRLANGYEFTTLFTCPPQQRKELLMRMMGGKDPTSELQSVREQLAFDTTSPPSPLQVPSVGPSTNAQERDNGLPLRENVNQQAIKEPQSDSTPPKDLQIIQKTHKPTKPGTSTPLRIQQKSESNSQPITHTCKVTDGAFCEKKVIEFEENDNPPRFPVPVGHITGYDAPGCDILTFDSAEQRDAFELDKDSSRVSRFIEVKGRSNEKAKIDLKGNELSAAERYRERYYLYRLYKLKEGELLLTILRDPIGQKEALHQIIEVDLDRAKATEKFQLSGGLLQLEDKGDEVNITDRQQPNHSPNIQII